MKLLMLKIIKLTNESKLLLVLIVLLGLIGVSMQYSAGEAIASKYAIPFLIRYLLAICILIFLYLSNLKLIFLLTEYFYMFSLFLLILVQVLGETHLGAKRWLDLHVIIIQPSEIMKIALVLILAKYFHNFSLSQLGKLRYYLLPILYTVVPLVLIIKEPDLGTAMILCMISFVLFFLSSLPMKFFYIILGTVILLIPFFWLTLYDYQKDRILTFINPERDPIGSGYHIIQSKIAIGSGGFLGKGFLQGTQARLDFLPEKHTDFIFTLIAEEFGFLGVFFLIFIYISVIILLTSMVVKCQHNYGKYVISGFSFMFFAYVFINIAMVSGLIPVVGVPLPLISYGGTSLLTIMIAFGISLNIANSSPYL